MDAQAQDQARFNDFCQALGEFLGGTNQVRMSMALQLGGEMKAVAELWRSMRSSVPGIFGYPTADEAAASVREWLRPTEASRRRPGQRAR